LAMNRAISCSPAPPPALSLLQLKNINPDYSCCADRRSLLYYKHVEETLFAASTEASSCLTYHNTVLLFPNIFSKPVVARFDQRQDSSEKLHVTLNKDPSLAAIADARVRGIREFRTTRSNGHPIIPGASWSARVSAGP